MPKPRQRPAIKYGIGKRRKIRIRMPAKKTSIVTGIVLAALWRPMSLGRVKPAAIAPMAKAISPAANHFAESCSVCAT